MSDIKQTIVYQPWFVGLNRQCNTMGCFYKKEAAEKVLSDMTRGFSASTLSGSGIDEIILFGDPNE